MLIIQLISAAHIYAAQPLDPTLQKAVNQISNADDGTSLSAIQTLGRSRNKSAAVPLIAAFASEQRPLIRRSIVDALNLIRNPASKPALLAALQDPDTSVRQSAVVALEGLGDIDSAAVLIKRASSERDPAVKAYLVKFYGRSKHPQASAALKTLAQDRDSNVQKLAQIEMKRKNKTTNNGQ